MKRVLITLGLMISASGPALALDLKKAKFPIEYECRMTHSGGIAFLKDGTWWSGSMNPDSTPFLYIVERFDDVRQPARKGACEVSQRLSRAYSAEGYCLTLMQAGDASLGSLSEFCTVTGWSGVQNRNSVLKCEGGTVLDTDRRVLLGVGTFRSYVLGLEQPQASVWKSDCIRLDR